MERNWALVQVCLSRAGIKQPPMTAGLAGQLVPLVVGEAKEKVELPKLVLQLRLELCRLVAVRAVPLLGRANGDNSFPLADVEHHAITLFGRHLTPELSRAAQRPRRWDNLSASAEAAKRTRLERIVRQEAQVLLPYS